MTQVSSLRAAALGLALILTPSCTLVAIDSQTGPPGVDVDGIVEGHAAFGFRDEDQVFSLDLFDGTSDGAIGELVIWKLARLEVGLAGLAIGLGPIDLALGTLFYDPVRPPFHGDHEDHDHDHDGDHDHDEDHDHDHDDD